VCWLYLQSCTWKPTLIVISCDLEYVRKLLVYKLDGSSRVCLLSLPASGSSNVLIIAHVALSQHQLSPVCLSTDRVFYGGFSVRHPADSVRPRRHVATRHRRHPLLPQTRFFPTHRTEGMQSSCHISSGPFHVGNLLGPFYGAIAVPSVTRCRCCRRRRCGRRSAGGVRQ